MQKNSKGQCSDSAKWKRYDDPMSTIQSKGKRKSEAVSSYFEKTKYHLTWSLDLPNYMKCLNNEKRREQDWHTAFKVYFGRKLNELVFYGLPKNRGSPVVRKFRNWQKMTSIYLKTAPENKKRSTWFWQKGCKRTVKN